MLDNPKSNTRIFDSGTQLKDAGLVAADAANQVGGSNKIINVGAGEVYAEAVIDVTAIETATGDEVYRICVQGSTSPTFASGIENLAIIDLGASAARSGGAATSTIGRYKLPVCNEKNGTVYPYIRGYTDVAGTIATGINYSMFLDLIRHT